MKRFFVTLAALATLGFVTPAEASDPIRIVGSSTVYPFATAVAENFGKTSLFKTPVVESTGSGGGFKLFCSGVGVKTPVITVASRKIVDSEFGACQRNGVADIVEVKIGFDGIVLANARGAARVNLSKQQIFRALAKDVPINGKLVANPYKTWRDVDTSLPEAKIEVLGPPPTSGTRDAFVGLAMEDGAKAIPMLEKMRSEDKKAFSAVAHTIREDGAYIEAGENDNLIVRKLEANPTSFGIFGFSFLDQNSDKVQGCTVGGVEPTFEAIASGDYGISRSLYLYVKKAHVGVVPGLQEYLDEFTSARASGDEGYLADKGLIPLPVAERNAATHLVPMTAAVSTQH